MFTRECRYVLFIGLAVSVFCTCCLTGRIYCIPLLERAGYHLFYFSLNLFTLLFFSSLFKLGSLFLISCSPLNPDWCDLKANIKLTSPLITMINHQISNTWSYSDIDINNHFITQIWPLKSVIFSTNFIVRVWLWSVLRLSFASLILFFVFEF